MAQPVVARYDWACVKENKKKNGLVGYDVWQWNPYKLKWVRMSNHACGFGELHYASKAAKEISDETQAMLDNNQQKPAPL